MNEPFCTSIVIIEGYDGGGPFDRQNIELQLKKWLNEGHIEAIESNVPSVQYYKYLRTPAKASVIFVLGRERYAPVIAEFLRPH